MTKNEIVEIVSQKINQNEERIKKEHIKAIIDCALFTFIDLLTMEGHVEIRNFGTFKLKKTPSRVGRNPITLEETKVPERNIVQFKAGKYMKDRVSQK